MFKRIALVFTVSAVAALSFAAGWGHLQRTAAAAAQPIATPGRPSPLPGVAAIIEADLTAGHYVFDETMGPRTQYDLANVRVHAGRIMSIDSLSQFGGTLPDGRGIFASDLPVLAPGARYIIFLGAAPWFYTPVWSYLIFRVETIAGRTVVIGPNGRPVTTFTKDGVTFSPLTVIDYSQTTDPLSPIALTQGISSTDAGITSALDHDSFVAAAVSASTDGGANFGVSVPVIPILLGGASKWNTVTGSPIPGGM